MNLRPSGYEPDELPDCSTPHQERNYGDRVVKMQAIVMRRRRLCVLVVDADTADSD